MHIYIFFFGRNEKSMITRAHRSPFPEANSLMKKKILLENDLRK